MRRSGLLPAMMPALMAPIDVPISNRARYRPLQRLIDAALIGSERATALQHQYNLTF